MEPTFSKAVFEPCSHQVLTLCAIGGAVAVGVGTAMGPMPGLLAVGVVAAGIWLLLADTAFLGLVLVGAAPTLCGLRRGLPVPGLRISEVVIVGLGALIIIRHRGAARAWGAVEWLLLLYVALTVLLGLFAVRQERLVLSGDNLGTLVGPLQFLLLYRAVQCALFTPELRRKALRVVLWCSVPVSLLAVLQYVGIRPVPALLATLTGSQNFEFNTLLGFQYRATGPFPHWHVLGGYLLAVLLIASALLLQDRGCDGVVGPRGMLAIVIPATVALVATYTFSIYFGVVAGIALIAAWTTGIRRLLPWLAAAAVLAAGVFGGSILERLESQYASNAAQGRSPYIPQTLQYRLEIWEEQYLPALEGRWMTGVGPNDPPEVRWKYSESLYLSLVLRGGIPLVVVFLSLSWAIFVRARRRFSCDDPSVRALARTIAALIVVLIPMHAVFPYFVSSGLPHAFFVLAGLCFVGARSQDEKAESLRNRGRAQGGGV